MTLETTPKVDDAWSAYVKSGDYAATFGTLGGRLHAKGLSRADAQRIYIEPSQFVAEGLRSSGVRVFGADVDYTDEKIFRPLLENMNPPRGMPDNDFAKIFVGDRNRAMSAKANALLKAGTCTRVVMSMGSAHVRPFVGRDRTFPGYTGDPLPGVLAGLDPAFAGKPFVIGLNADRARSCPADCDLVSTPVKLNDLNITAP